MESPTTLVRIEAARAAEVEGRQLGERGPHCGLSHKEEAREAIVCTYFVTGAVLAIPARTLPAEPPNGNPSS